MSIMHWQAWNILEMYFIIKNDAKYSFNDLLDNFGPYL